MNARSVTLLLVEDDDVDVESLRRAFQKARIANPIVRARDGVEAIELLRGVAPHPPLPRPYLILLDLKMPRMGGLEFLGELRRDPVHQDAVVFVLTTSSDEEDKVKAYNHKVAGYIPKSTLPDPFIDLTVMLDYYWRIVELP